MKNISVLIIILSVSLFACKKSNDSNSVTSTSPIPKLSKVIALDTTSSIPNDTLRVENYTYDNSGRVVLQEAYGLDASGDYFTETSQYLYNGTDTLPSKTIITTKDAGDTITENTFHSYLNRTRYLVVDSTISVYNGVSGISTDTFVIHYSYSDTSILIVQDSYTSWGGHTTYPTVTTKVTRSNGNIIYEHQILGSGTTTEANCTYDSHPNAYYNVAWISNTLIPNTSTEYYPYAYGLNNNVTEINNTYSSPINPSVIHYKYSYQYRADGYPIEIIIQNQGSTTPGNLNKVLYSYYPTL